MGSFARGALALALALSTPLAAAQRRRPVRPAPAAEAPADDVNTPPADPTQAFQQGEARTHFQTGVQHYQAGRFAEAIQEFQTAYRLFASPVILFNLAQAYRSDNQLTQSIATFRRYVDENPRITPEQREDVEGLIREIDGSRAVLSFEVEPSGAAVTLDGRALGTAPLPRGVELLPGSHDISITLANHEPLTQTIAVHPHERRLFNATLHPVDRNARLVVTVVPSDADITLDGAPAGRGAIDEHVTPGTHRITFAAQGYLPRSEEVRVGVLGEETVRATLDPRPRPIYTRWWFWTAIGGVVATGATLGVVLNPIHPSAIPGNSTPQSVSTIIVH